MPNGYVTAVLYVGGGLCNGLLNASATTALYADLAREERTSGQAVYMGLLNAAVGVGYGIGSLCTAYPRGATFLAGAWCVVAVLIARYVSRAVASATGRRSRR